MKRKIFSKLLMGAFLIASISSFVSCKDYDDDIKDIKADMQKLALQTSIDNLQSQLTSAASTAQSALAKAEAAATQSALGDVKADLAAVQAAAQTAGENAAKGINDAAAAKSAADAAQGTADAAAVAAAAAGEAAKAAGDMAAQAQAAADKAQAAVDAAVAAGATKEAVAAVEAEAKKAAEAAEAAAKAAEEKAAAAQSAAEATAKSLAAAAQADAVKAANAYTDAAIAAIKADIAKMSFEEKDAKAMAEIAKIQAEVGKIAKLEAEVAKIAGLSQGLDDLKAEVAALKAASDSQEFVEAMTALTAKVDGYQAAINALYDAVTSVELVGTFNGNPGDGVISLPNTGYALVFNHGKQVASEKFGNNESSYFSFPAADQIEYTAGNDIRTDNAFLIRVSPANAVLAIDNITIVDSKNRDLSSVMEITGVERYDGLITRAALENNLWKVSVKVKDGITLEQFNAKITANGNTRWWDVNNQILYAIAVKNTTDADDAEIARYVNSSYDLAPRVQDYVAARNVTFTVGGTAVANIKNRWYAAGTAPNAALGDCVYTEDGTYTFSNPEYSWRTYVDAYGVPYWKPEAIPTISNDPNTNNVVSNDPIGINNDFRGTRDFKAVTANRAFRIANVAGDDGVTGYYSQIEYYYVTLDRMNAIESGASEWQAWSRYDIEGLGVMKKANEPLDITIKNNVNDYIGFRLFAVNYDGTLADPDGKAFYVQVGNPIATSAATVSSAMAYTIGTIAAAPTSWNAVNNNKNNVITYTVDPSDYVGTIAIANAFSTALDANNAAGSTTIARTSRNHAQLSGNLNVYWALYRDNSNIARNWGEVKKVKVIVANPEVMVDGATVSFTISGKDPGQHDQIVNRLTLAITKVLPTTAPDAVDWRTNQAPVDGALTVYPTPAGGTWQNLTADAATGTKDLNLHTNGVIWNTYTAANYLYDWTLNNFNPNTATPDEVIPSLQAATTINVAKGKIGKSYETVINYVYKNASRTYDPNIDAYTTKDVKVAADQFTTTFASAADLLTYGVPSYNAYTDAAVGTPGTAGYVPAQNHWTSNYYLKWSTLTGAASTANVYKQDGANTRNTALAATLANLIQVTTSASNKIVAQNAGIPAASTNTFDISMYRNSVNAASSVDVTITGEAATYVDIAETGGALTFTGKVGDNPTANLNGNIKVTGKDAFGKSHSIELPIILLFNE